MNPKPVTLSPGCKTRASPGVHTAFSEDSIKWHSQTFYVPFNCTWVWQLNLHPLTHCSLIKLQAPTLHRFSPAVFLLHFPLCGKDTALIWGSGMWHRHPVPAWCHLSRVQRWHHPFLGCSPSAQSQSAQTHSWPSDGLEKSGIPQDASCQPCGDGSAGLQAEKGMERSEPLTHSSTSPFGAPFAIAATLHTGIVREGRNILSPWDDSGQGDWIQVISKVPSTPGCSIIRLFHVSMIMQIHISICWRIYLNSASVLVATLK